MSNDEGKSPGMIPEQGDAGRPSRNTKIFSHHGMPWRAGPPDDPVGAEYWDADAGEWIAGDHRLDGPRPAASEPDGSAAVQDYGQGGLFADYQSAEADTPTLYSCAWSSGQTPLASLGADARFHRCPGPGPGGRPRRLGQLLACGSRLIAADLDAPQLWMTHDPCCGEWEPMAHPRWDSPDNTRVSHLTRHGEQLQVFLDNPARGFEIWRSHDAGANWQQVVFDGAYRFQRNALVTAVAQDRERTFFATASNRADPFGSGRPVGFELLSIDTSGEWAVLSGDCRCTPDGLRVPLLAHGPSIDDGDEHRVMALGWVADVLFLLTARRRLWRVAGSEVQRLPIDDSPAPDGILVSEGVAWLTLEGDGSAALQRLQ